MSTSRNLELAAGSRERLDNIDALRALAVLAVMLFHYTARYPLDYVYFRQPVWRASYGYMGVELFFIISGYCIYMTATHCASVAQFWSRRISRLQPAYMAAILITFLVVAQYGLPGRQFIGLAALANVVWLNGINLAPNIDGVYWSLIVEIKLYLFFGVVFFGLRKLGSPVLCWTVLCVFGAAIAEWDMRMNGSAISTSTQMMATFVFPHSLFFLMGMLIYRWQSTAALLKVLAVTAFAWACYRMGRNWTECAILFALFPLSKLVLDWKTLWVPSPIVFVGFISYPLYLIHQNVGIVIIRQTAWDIPSEYGRIALAIAIVIALAALVSFTVEHRFRKMLERPIEAILSFVVKLPVLMITLPMRLLRPAAAVRPVPEVLQHQSEDGRQGTDRALGLQ